MDYTTQAITANAVAAVLLLILIANFISKFKTEKDDMKVYFWMLLLNLFLCIADPLAIVLDGKLFPGAIQLNTAINALLYIATICYSTMWAVYADLRVELSSRNLTLANFLKFVPAMLVIAGSIVNLFTPVFFRVTERNIYERTDLFFLTYLATYFYFAAGTVISYGFGRRSQKYVFLPAALFIGPAFLASILQYLFYGISVLWAGSAIGLTCAYVALLDEGTAVDSLSGAYTRHYLNVHLDVLCSKNLTVGRRSVRSIRRNPNKLVAGIMLDIDNFKAINDRFGHLEGDDALRQVGKLLLNAVNPYGTVYRFAGDEFTIILQVDTDREILTVLDRINAAVIKHNQETEKPYHISFSAGHTIYAPGELVAEFVGRMDNAMYGDKKRKMLRLAGENSALAEEYRVNPDRNRILIVDDDFINREIMKNIFPAQYRIEEATNGEEALNLIRVYADSLCAILTDLEMPGMNGVELLRYLHDHRITEGIPTFLVTANDEYDIAKQAYELGVVDVINKPVVPFVILRRVQSILELFHARESLRATVQGQEKQLQENANTIDTLHRSTIEALASAIEFRDVESGEHTNRIYAITKYLLTHTAMGEGFTGSEIENMAIGSIMHDLGKIAISDVILNKPGKLTQEEYETMKLHSVKGGELLEHISRRHSHPSYVYAADIARHHHERWDGRGYPDGLKGNEITPWAQVASIADVYDALLSPRVYKKAYTPEEAVEMIRTGQCGTFGPKLLECFLQAEPEIRRQYLENQDLSQPDQQIVPATSQEVMNVMLLIDAVRTAYDMIFAANLTRNTYTMIDDETFLSNRVNSGNVFDQMARKAWEAVPQSHQPQFAQALFREPLLEAFGRGIRKVSLEYPEATDDGQLRNVSTTVILMEDSRSGEILDITLTRYMN